VDPKAVPTAKTMDRRAFENAVAVQVLVRVQEINVLGLPLVGREVAPTARTMDQQVFENAVAVQVLAPAPAAARQEPHVTGTAVEEHVEESGKPRVRTQDANFLGVLRSACLITPLLEPSAILQVPLSLQPLLQEIPSGKMVLAAASASCSLPQLVER
jgi:hypothetical protein